VQEDLDELGVDWNIDALPSLLVIPYLNTRDSNGDVLIRLHKRSLPGVMYPPYLAPVTDPAGPVVLCESEFKALAAAQLGGRAIGVQGVDSFVNRLDELIAASTPWKPATVYVCMDTEHEIKADPAKPISRSSVKRAHTYAFAFERAGHDARIVDLDDKYLRDAQGKDGTKFRKADIDGALADGMTPAEFHQCLQNGRSFADYPAPIVVKVGAIWQVCREACFKDVKIWRDLLANRSITEQHRALTALAACARQIAWKADGKQYDRAILESVAKELHGALRRSIKGLSIAAVRKAVSPPGKHAIDTKQLTLSDLGIIVGDGVVLKTRNSRDDQFEQASNFTVEQIRTGSARFIDGQTERVNRITVQTVNDQFEIEVLGDVFDVQAYCDDPQNRLVVLDRKTFRQYIAHRIDRGKIRSKDSKLERVFAVGTFVNAEGDLVPSDGVHFPQGREESVYHGHRFATSGSKLIFDRFAALIRSQHLAMVLVWALGSLLKPKLGWAYPHLVVTADSGTGKSTWAGILEARFGWRSIAGPTEFQTSYRTKKSFANTNVPIQVEEIGRLSNQARQWLIQNANLAYNRELSTHGHLDKRFVLCAPMLAWGQDFGVRDVALATKVIRADLRTADKDRDALASLRATSDVWPMADWARFLCEWVNRRNLLALLAEKSSWLREQVDSDQYIEASNTDRVFWNYAAVLVSADAVAAFGVNVDITDVTVETLRAQLCDQSERPSIARQFLAKLIDEITARPNGIIQHLESRGLFFKPEQALPQLENRGFSFDISDPATLRRMLVNEGLGEASVAHRFGGRQLRAFHVPPEILAELGCTALGSADVNPDGEGEPDEEL